MTIEHVILEQGQKLLVKIPKSARVEEVSSVSSLLTRVLGADNFIIVHSDLEILILSKYLHEKMDK